MKKLFLGATLLVAGLATSKAQIQKGNFMVGGEVANMRFTNGLNISLTPKVGYFVVDNWAVGAQVGLQVYKTSGSGDTQTNWTAGAFTRYYLGDNQVDNLLKNGRFFGEASLGFGGNNVGSGSSSTNGADLAIGAGYSYFVTKNVSLDALLKLGTIVGAGSSSAKGNLSLNVGFQIFLPSSKVKNALQDK